MIDALLLTVSSPAATTTQQANCMGVAVETPSGWVNLVSLHVEGAPSAIDKIKIASKPFDVELFKEERTGELGKIDLVFSTKTRSADVKSLYDRLIKGKFGAVSIRPWVMPIDTLPIEKCPRT